MKLGGYKSDLVDRRPMWSIYDLCDKFGLEVKSTSHKLRGNGAPQIVKKVKGSTMDEIFENSSMLSVRWYEIIGYDDKKDWNPKTSYKFRIIVRHPEESDAKTLFNEEIERVETLCKTK